MRGVALARTASGVGLNLQNSGAAVPNWSRFLISVNKLSGHSQRQRRLWRLGRKQCLPAIWLGSYRLRISKAEHRRALELLARCTDGCSEAVLLAHGFRPKLIPELVRTGLATTQ